MKKFMTIIAISALLGTPVLAQEHEHMPGHDMTHMEGSMHGKHMGHAAEDGEREAMPSVRQVEASKVCMVNDMAFDQDQIAVEVDGKTYYGCCPMCKDRLESDASLRTATDPVSGAEVDKATAVIGADADGNVYYFESEHNLHTHMGM